MRKVISLLLPQAQRDNTVPNLQQFSLLKTVIYQN